MVMVLDLTHILNFHGQIVNGLKMLLFLELITVLRSMLIIKNILVLDEVPTQGLDDATITAKAKYPSNFTRSGRRFEWSLHYNANNSFLFVNATKMYKLKAKDSETKPYLLRLGNILNDSAIQNMKKTGLIGYTHVFCCWL